MLQAEIFKAQEKATKVLLASQNKKDGWWKGELETNVAIESEDLMMREFLGIGTPEITVPTANWIRSQLRDDGTWSNFYDGSPELSTTTEAYVALRIAGDSADAKHMKNIREFILDSGGLESTRIFTRIWMSLFGEWDYADLPTLRPEMMYLPGWVPFNIYNFACWARQTIVPILILGALKPVHPVLSFNVDELRTGKVPLERQKKKLITRQGRLQKLDKAASIVGKVSPKFVERHAIKKAEQWILDRQEADGSWGGIYGPWVFSILALSSLGYGVDHPIIKKAIEGLDVFTIRKGDVRRLECCQSPIWDTALSIVALVDAKVPCDDKDLIKAGKWLLNKENKSYGDWSKKRPRLKPGGWAFEYHNSNYPDVDDTAEVVLALDRLRSGFDKNNKKEKELDKEIVDAINRAVAWVEGMQCRDGGYGAFDVNNDKTLINDLPFCDFGSVLDPPTEDVTAHTIEMLTYLKRDSNYKVDQARFDKSLKWLLKQQKADGSWYGRWGCNYIYGAGAVIPALIDAGIDKTHKSITATVEWLLKVQNPDGGWGEDIRSYTNLDLKGKGETTASQTAWAVMALVSAGEMDLALKGVKWLVKNQNSDGTWDELHYTGTGFPQDFYIKYHLYRNIFPLTAISRYLSHKN